MSKKKTHDEYIQELSVINNNIEVKEQYIGANVPILHKCKRDGYEWKIKPSHALRGHGCPVCANNVRKTNEQYLCEIKEKGINVVPLEKYVNHKTPILHRCIIHNYDWTTTPERVLNGKGCPRCAIEKSAIARTRTQKEYIQEVFQINPNIEVVGKYVNASTKIEHRCLIDGYVWNTTPDAILQWHGCPLCSGHMLKTTEQYVAEIKKININIVVIGEYINAKTKILHKCKKCGHEWYAYPSNILSGKGCPKCNMSKGETEIGIWLDSKNIKYIQQYTFVDCRDKNPLPFDFYVPQYNLCIEYDGEQHYTPVTFGGMDENLAIEQFKKTQYHDEIKTTYCKDNDIQLLRIPYFKNIQNELEVCLFNTVTMNR